MKFLKYIILTVVSAFVFASCELNEPPTFDDNDAFVAFMSSSLTVGEEKDSLVIPVMLTSLSGIVTTVEFEVVDSTSTAIEGTHFTVRNSTNVLAFTKENPVQYIILDIIDNATFDGDVKLDISLKNPVSVDLGNSKLATITISDDEHPLLFILGACTAKGTSYFNGAEEWTVTISKDATDLTKVWITNFVSGGSSATSPIYGVVNPEKTEIRIPVKQAIAVSTSYPRINLEGYYGPDGATKIPTGGYITGEIAEDGTITIKDEFGSQVFTDADATVSAGWYNIYQTDVTIKKN